MSQAVPTKRERPRTPNNRTTTGFRISDELWAVFQPLLPDHPNTHRFGGGRPRVPDRRCYDYDEVRAIVTEFGFTARIRARGEEAQAIRRETGFKARSFVVERAHSWMNRFRRLLIRWDKKPNNYLGFLHFACGLIAFRSAGIFG
jgi:putative transposase